MLKKHLVKTRVKVPLNYRCINSGWAFQLHFFELLTTLALYFNTLNVNILQNKLTKPY